MAGQKAEEIDDDHAKQSWGGWALKVALLGATKLLPMQLLLSSNQANGNSQPKVISLKTSNPFRGECTLRQLLAFMMMVFLLSYIVFSIVVQQTFENYYNQLESSAKVLSEIGQTNNYSECILKQNHQPDPLTDFLETLKLLKYIGCLNMFVVFDSFTRYIITTLGIFASIPLLTSLMLSFQEPINMSLFSFLVDCNAERGRIEASLAKLACRISRHPDAVEQILQTFGQTRCPHSRTISGRELIKSNSSLLVRQTRHEFKRQLELEPAHRTFGPRSVSASSLKMYYNTVLAICLGYLVFIIVAALVILIKVLINQVEASLAERLAEAKCEHWHRDGRLARPWRLDFEDTFWEENWQKYAQSEPESSLFWLEVRHHLMSFDAIISYALAIILALQYFALSVLVSIIYICNFQYQLVWLDELGGQLDSLSAKMDKEIARRRSQQENGEASDSAGAIHGAFAACYLNFEMFRNQHAASKKISNQFATVCLINSGGLFLLTYSMYDSAISRLLPYMMYMSGVAFVVVNAVCASSALVVLRVERISVKLMQCLARTVDLQQELSLIVMLWRRQLIDKQDFVGQYALSLFGIQFTHERIIELNTNLIGLALVIYVEFYR